MHYFKKNYLTPVHLLLKFLLSKIVVKIIVCYFTIVILTAIHAMYWSCWYLSLFSQTASEPVEFQPALVTLFCRRNSDEMSAKEMVKEHLWNIHFTEYGR
jgi:hypothetical protein